MRIDHYSSSEPGDAGAPEPPSRLGGLLSAAHGDGMPEVRFPVTRHELRALERAAARRHVTVAQYAYEASRDAALGGGRAPDPHRPAA